MAFTPPASIVCSGHNDFPILNPVRDAILNLGGGEDVFRKNFCKCIRDAIDYVIDAAKTGRTSIEHLDKVEKTFVGLKVQHVIRDMLGAPQGLAPLLINGTEVDVKNTVRDNWMIPPEVYRAEGVSLLVASNEEALRCWLGLIVARDEYLTKPNRDAKRSVKRGSLKHILWILKNIEYPPSPWAALDLTHFGELRRVEGGTKRLCRFFRENLGVPISREVIRILLSDQMDYMKRIRGNGGARDQLRAEGIAVLSGSFDRDRAVIGELGLEDPGRDGFIAVKAKSSVESVILGLTRDV